MVSSKEASAVDPLQEAAASLVLSQEDEKMKKEGVPVSVETAPFPDAPTTKEEDDIPTERLSAVALVLDDSALGEKQRLKASNENATPQPTAAIAITEGDPIKRKIKEGALLQVAAVPPPSHRPVLVNASHSSQPGAVAVEGSGDIPEHLRPAAASSSGSVISEESNLVEEGMVQARPVQDNANLPSARPLDEKKGGTGGSSKKLLLAIGGLVVLVGVVLLVVFLTKKDSNGSTTSQPTVATTTVAPATPVPLVLELPPYTLEALQDPNSPQSQAYEWLLQNPQLDLYPEWKKAQRFALATFYYSLGGPDWILGDKWLDLEWDECNWDYKTLVGSAQNVGYMEQQENLADSLERMDQVCDNEGRYQFLVFPANQLHGTIPKETALLSSGLVYIEISANEIEVTGETITGSIPTELALLTKLRRFYSERNEHTGRIPTELGLLTNLEELDIGYNPFEGGVPTELGNLGASLKLLSIKRSGVTGFLPTELYRLTNLETFFLHGNTDITGGLLLPEIGNMKKMQRFVAHDIPYNGPIPSEIGLLTDMWEFNLWNTGVNGSIPKEFFELTNMKRLDIDDNQLSGTFPEGLGNFTDLTQLFINGNILTGTLPEGIFEHLGKLTYLKLNDNPVTGTIPSDIGNLNSSLMGDLLMAHTALSGTIPSEIGRLTMLKKLVLHGIKDLFGTIPNELLGLPELDLLTVSNTSLTGSIPDDLCDSLFDYEYTCTSIQGLYEICYDLKKVNFTCDNSLLCGCDCEECKSNGTMV